MTKEEIVKKWEESGLLNGRIEMNNSHKMLKIFKPKNMEVVEVIPIAKRLLNGLPKDQEDII